MTGSIDLMQTVMLAIASKKYLQSIPCYMMNESYANWIRRIANPTVQILPTTWWMWNRYPTVEHLALDAGPAIGSTDILCVAVVIADRCGRNCFSQPDADVIWRLEEQSPASLVPWPIGDGLRTLIGTPIGLLWPTMNQILYSIFGTKGAPTSLLRTVADLIEESLSWPLQQQMAMISAADVYGEAEPCCC